jgi:hypothetical protein
VFMVIFGAGASYDSGPSNPLPELREGENQTWRPPLAVELLHNNYSFNQIQRNYHEMDPIVPYLRDVGSDKSIEQVLFHLQLEAESDGERAKQIAAFRYYLQDLFRAVKQVWLGNETNGISNYKTFYDQLRRANVSKLPIPIVTFNYDTLFENALEEIGLKYNNMDDYTSNGLVSLYKLHGSVDWSHPIIHDLEIPGRSDIEIVRIIIENFRNITIDSEFVLTKRPIHSLNGPTAIIEKNLFFPAIAIPVDQKSKFECPSTHLEHLSSAIVDVKKIIIVGWRGAESHFLKILKENLSSKVEIIAVCGSRGAAYETFESLRRAEINFNGVAYDGGFSKFTTGRAVEDFLRR